MTIRGIVGEMEMKCISKSVDNSVAWIEINRENKLNALDYDSLKELELVFDSIREDSSIRCIVITGSGEKAFCAGADIEYYVNIHPIKALEFMRFAQKVLRKIETMPQPVIAAINGYALGGGCELSLACDIRIASNNAKLGLPEVHLGLFPGWGGTQRLPRIIGIGLAKQMILTGKTVTAQEAENIGLITSVASSISDLKIQAKELAQLFASKSGIGLALAKEAIHKSFDNDLLSGLDYEAVNLSLVYSGKDSQEGIQAFLEKREPIFLGGNDID